MAAAPRAARPAQLHALTTLRFVAAGMIVLSHADPFFNVRGTIAIYVPLEQGVTFFFVLSGFILVHAYPSVPPGRVAHFWWARVARIWPAHVVALALVPVLLGPANLPPTDTPVSALANLALIHAWIPLNDVAFSFNLVSWSISTELAFYLAFPFLVRDLERTWAWKLGASVAIAGLMVWIGNAVLSVSPDLSHGLIPSLVYSNPLARLGEFTLGMCSYLLWRRTLVDCRGGPWCTAREAIAFLAVGGLLVAATQLRPYAQRGFGVAMGLGPSTSALAAIGFAAVIFATACGHGALSRVLGLKALTVLGEVSYAIYLVHQTLFRFWGPTGPWLLRGLDLSPVTSFALCLGVVFAVALLLWRLVERPCRRYLVGLVGGSATQRAGP